MAITITKIQLRRGTAAQWTEENPILQAGEPGFVLDTGQCKIGDGITPWDSLPFLAGGGGEGGVSDHGALTGLADDDHTQYHNNTRGDARYYTQAQVDSGLAAKANTSHGHVVGDTTGLQTALDGKAATTHGHVVGDTTGLQTALDGKAATAHEHPVADIDATGTPDATTFLRGDGAWSDGPQGEPGVGFEAVQDTEPDTTEWTAGMFWFDTSIGSLIAAVQATLPDTTGWAPNTFWYDTSTEV